jgi:hypothetical protein
MKDTRGWGPWRKDWYSVCSKHRVTQDDCGMCNAGHWVNNWVHLAGGFVFKVSPRLWRWWVNRLFLKKRWIKELNNGRLDSKKR